METKVPKMDRKIKKMIKDLEGKLDEGQLQITDGKGEDKNPRKKMEPRHQRAKRQLFSSLGK